MRQWYLKKLQEDPLKTKMFTSGSLAALQEFLASWIAKDRNKSGHYFTSRVPKMAVYGAFISAPLGHVMISLLQKAFRGRTSLKSKILQIIVSNLVVRIPQPARKTLQADTVSTDLTHPERSLPLQHGHHCWCAYFPPDPRYRSRGLHACHEGLLGHIPDCPRIRTGIPSPRDLGALLQHHRFHHWNLHQLTHQEKEAASPEEEVQRWSRRRSRRQDQRRKIRLWSPRLLGDHKAIKRGWRPS